MGSEDRQRYGQGQTGSQMAQLSDFVVVATRSARMVLRFA
jgi:hypothetical protein